MDASNLSLVGALLEIRRVTVTVGFNSFMVGGLRAGLAGCTTIFRQREGKGHGPFVLDAER